MNDDHDIRESVKKEYSSVASEPSGAHPFPVGRLFAEELGYPKELLDTLPSEAIDSFTGASNVAVFAEIPERSVVLDIGCGAGLDSLVACQKTGPRGLVIGLDFSTAMLARAAYARKTMGLAPLLFSCADAEALPLKAESIDIVLINGIFNLNPLRSHIFSEISRVIRPGGTVYAAELVLLDPSSANVCTLTNWHT